MKKKQFWSRLGRLYCSKSDKGIYISHFHLFKYATLLDKWLMILGVIASAIAGVLKPVNTILIGDLMEVLIKHSSIYNFQDNATIEDINEANNSLFKGIKRYSLLSSLIGVATFIFQYLSVAFFSYSASRQIFKIRTQYLKALLNQDITRYDQDLNGDLLTGMTSCIDKMEDGMGEKFIMFINIFIIFIASSIVSLIKNWKIALIGLSPIPIVMIINCLIDLVTSKLTRNEMEAYRKAGSIAEETFSLIKTVAAFNGQNKEIDRYNKYIKEAKVNNVRRSFFIGLSNGAMQFFVFLSYGLIFWFGVNFVIDKQNPTNEIRNIFTIIFCTVTGSLNITQASAYLESFAMAKAGALQVFNVMENEPIINVAQENKMTVADFKGAVEFKSVKFHYPTRPEITVLKNVNIKIKEGTKVAIVGSSGCGKSTIVQLIERFYDPVAGEILFDGFNSKDLNLKWLRSKIGVVGQEPVLFNTTILENIKYGKEDATDGEVIAAAKKANAHNFIRLLPNGYLTVVGQQGTQLSGGQKQRIAIARALIKNPTILILDESTSALDSKSENKVQAALDSISLTCTTIVIAHRLSTIRRADKIIVLSEGVVVEEGNHDELIKMKKEYYKLFTAQTPHREMEKEYGVNVSGVDDDEDFIISNNMESNEKDDSEQSHDISAIALLKLNAPEWHFLIPACIASIIIGCSIVILSNLYSNIAWKLSDNRDISNLLTEVDKICLYFLFVGLILLFSAIIQSYFLGLAGEKMTERIRKKLFSTILTQEMSFFDKKSNAVGFLCSKLSKDATDIQGATGQRIGSLLQSLTAILVALGLSFYFNWKLAIVTSVFTPPIIMSMFYVKRSPDSKQSIFIEKSILNSIQIAQEAVANIRTVASLVMEENVLKKFVNELVPSYEASLGKANRRGIVYAIPPSVTIFAYAAVIYYGGFFIAEGLHFTKMIMIAQTQLIGCLLVAQSLVFCPNLLTGVDAAKKIQHFLSKVKIIKKESISNTLSQVKGSVCYSNIRFSYPTRPKIEILKGVNLNVGAGKTVALVGESGSGKSTVIQLLEKFYDPTSGAIYFDHNDIKYMSSFRLRTQLSIVSQEPNLFNKTIKENIAYGDNSREVPMEEIIQNAKIANIHNFITGLPQGYNTLLGDKTSQLSGGQKQRIALARALIKNPVVLILDEATSALDYQSEKLVQEALNQAKNGRTCITITHRFTNLVEADLICVINEGMVVESGTHYQLLKKKGLYYQLYSQNISKEI